jgi:hypothetical protein
MIHGQFDVVPSVENRGITIRSTERIQQLKKLPAARSEVEIGKLNAENTLTVKKRVAMVDDANARDLLTTTANGLPVVGPGAGDMNNVTAIAHNHAMTILDAKLAEIDANLAQLADAK